MRSGALSSMEEESRLGPTISNLVMEPILAPNGWMALMIGFLETESL